MLEQRPMAKNPSSPKTHAKNPSVFLVLSQRFIAKIIKSKKTEKSQTLKNPETQKLNKTQFISNNQQQNQPTWPTWLIESNKHTNPEKPSQFDSQQQQAQPIHNRSKLKSAIIDPTTPTDSTL